MTTYIRGPVATYNRIENIQPEEWEKKITLEFPYGHTPITALLDSLSTENIQSRKFHWWTEEDAPLNGNITGIYTDSGMTTPSTGNAAADTVLYIRMPENDAKQILVNDTISITGRPNQSGISTFTDIIHADVRAVNIDGNNSRVTVKLLENLPAITTQTNLDWFIDGNAQTEGSMLPESVTTEPTEYENQTQIFMGSCEMTNSELAELERVEPDKWERTIKKALIRLRKQMEHSIIHSVYKSSYVNGKEKRHMKGLYQAISEYSNVYNIKRYRDIDSSFAGKEWVNVGLDILEDIVLRTSRVKTDADSKFVFTGDLGFTSINKLVREFNTLSYEWNPTQDVFGFKVRTLVGPIKSLNFVVHPLFNQINRFRRSALVIEGRYIKKKLFRPLMFISGKTGQDENGYDWVDARKCGWLTEFGISWNYIQNFCWIDNLGSNVDAT